ncbi:hypothetical protein HU200_041798 [Digitaria exilis]|uniref:Uncharacterized protein n=1 Tax=Digitaria exilis TaxID=1010633 RepID=A0A835EHL2_9POAL|nr:hypothetical protein HU200_041798 [Digitaria exilis]
MHHESNQARDKRKHRTCSKKGFSTCRPIITDFDDLLHALHQ